MSVNLQDFDVVSYIRNLFLVTTVRDPVSQFIYNIDLRNDISFWGCVDIGDKVASFEFVIIYDQS